MKLSFSLLACASATENATSVDSDDRGSFLEIYWINFDLAFWDWCNLKKIPGLFKKRNGIIDYGDLYKLKRSGKNPTTGETLDNPGKILK